MEEGIGDFARWVSDSYTEDVTDTDRVIALSRMSEKGQREILSIADKDIQIALLNLLYLDLIEEEDGGFRIKEK